MVYKTYKDKICAFRLQKDLKVYPFNTDSHLFLYNIPKPTSKTFETCEPTRAYCDDSTIKKSLKDLKKETNVTLCNLCGKCNPTKSKLVGQTSIEEIKIETREDLIARLGQKYVDFKFLEDRDNIRDNIESIIENDEDLRKELHNISLKKRQLESCWHLFCKEKHALELTYSNEPEKYFYI